MVVEEGVNESFEEGFGSVLNGHEDVGSGETVEVVEEVASQFPISTYQIKYRWKKNK